MEKALEKGLKTALSNEIAGEEFYIKAAKEAEDEFSKNTFTHLAKDEMYHIKRINDFIKTGKVAEIEAKIRNRNPESGLKFFQMTEKQFRGKKEEFFEKNRSPYELAIEFEMRSYNLYEKLAKNTKDEKTKEFFEFLMKEEQTHRKILEEALVFIEDPADYFLETEGWHFD